MSSPASETGTYPGHGDTVAARVGELYASHAKLVRSICRSLLRDRVDAEDATQQTFLSAQRALANGSSPRDAAAWLATIARHECLARVRSRMREPLPVDAETSETAPDAHVAAVRRQELAELRSALAGLPAQQRDAILLREVRGFSYEEVASTLSVTTSAVESLLFRARRSLQVQLREALASLSPAGLLQPLRELAGRLVGSGLAAPMAAKAVAIGLGTAVVSGGALLSGDVIGLGHAPAPRPAAARHVHRMAQRLGPEGPAAIWASSAGSLVDLQRAQRDGASGGDSGRSSETSGSSDSPGGTSDSGQKDGGGETTSTAGSSSETGDGGTQTSGTSDSGSGTSSTTSDSGSGDTTTTSASGDPTTTTTTGSDPTSVDSSTVDTTTTTVAGDVTGTTGSGSGTTATDSSGTGD